MKKNITSILKIVIVSLFLTTVISVFADTWPAPSTPPNSNTSKPINEGTIAQTKQGSLVLGTNSTTYTARGAFDILGSLATTGYVSTSGTNIFGNMGVGNLALSGITATTTPEQLCISTEGALMLCSEATSNNHGSFFSTATGPWTVPSGVSQITVELWGGGGSGPGTLASHFSNSSTNGGTSTFICNSAILTANGGTKATVGTQNNIIGNLNNTATYVNGTGGTWSTNSHSNIVSTTGSANGNSGSFTTGTNSTETISYSDPSYPPGYFGRFAIGGTGGNSIGGSSGTTGQTISKGANGRRYADKSGTGEASHNDPTADPYNFPNWANTGKAPGGGGTGPGGISGKSIEDWGAEASSASDCSTSPFPCTGKAGLPGGGGGGYVKAIINASSNTICSYTIGLGGIPKNQDSWWSVSGGANGGSGGVRITW